MNISAMPFSGGWEGMDFRHADIPGNKVTTNGCGPALDFDLSEAPPKGPKLDGHVDATWISYGHLAYDSQRDHLPQLHITASGWRAKLLALLIGPKRA